MSGISAKTPTQPWPMRPEASTPSRAQEGKSGTPVAGPCLHGTCMRPVKNAMQDSAGLGERAALS